MLDNSTMVKVTNRDTSYVSYVVQELNGLKRSFQPGETKEIAMSELRALAWSKGGRAVIKNHLIIHNAEAVAELVPDAEPEYFYGVKEVEQLLLSGSLDQLKDALDFAPEGVVSLIKEKAVELKINDLEKRTAILKKTNFNVTKAIEINEESQVVEEAPVRRAAPVNSAEVQPEAPQRRTAAPKYTIVSK